MWKIAIPYMPRFPFVPGPEMIPFPEPAEAGKEKEKAKLARKSSSWHGSEVRSIYTWHIQLMRDNWHLIARKHTNCSIIPGIRRG